MVTSYICDNVHAVWADSVIDTKGIVKHETTTGAARTIRDFVSTHSSQTAQLVMTVLTGVVMLDLP